MRWSRKGDRWTRTSHPEKGCSVVGFCLLSILSFCCSCRVKGAHINAQRNCLQCAADQTTTNCQVGTTASKCRIKENAPKTMHISMTVTCQLCGKVSHPHAPPVPPHLCQILRGSVQRTLPATRHFSNVSTSSMTSRGTDGCGIPVECCRQNGSCEIPRGNGSCEIPLQHGCSQHGLWTASMGRLKWRRVSVASCWVIAGLQHGLQSVVAPAGSFGLRQDGTLVKPHPS